MQASAFIDALMQDPLIHAMDWKQKRSGKVAGYLCSYAPEEIIWAAGVLPFRLMGTKNAIDRADAHLQAYCCSLVRGSLEDGLAGRLDFLDAMIFPHTCDSIQRLSDIWRLRMKSSFHADVLLPAKLDSDSASDYLIATFRKLIRDLENWLGRAITREMLAEAADLFNEIRSDLNTLLLFRQAHPEMISGSIFHAIVTASMWMDRDLYRRTLSGILEELKTQIPTASFPGKRIVLSGGICNVPDIYPVIEAAGAAIVGEDVCTGDRYFQGKIGIEGDMVENIAQRYLDRINCPSKHHGLYRRGHHLMQQVQETRADGVIFLFLKFCDPHGFDYPYMKEMLDQQGIPNMLFEIEDRNLSEGQFRTRCEAFIEML